MAVKFTKPEINITEKVAELDKPSGIAGEAMLRAETPQEQFNLISAGRKNMIINGGFDVWQRGTTVNTTMYSADRWMQWMTNSGVSNRNVNCTKQTGGPLGKNSSYIRYAPQVVDTGMEKFSWGQKIEKINLDHIQSGQKMTLSFWIKKEQNLPVDNNMDIQILRPDNVDGWTSIYLARQDANIDQTLASISFNSLSTNWKKYVYTFVPGDAVLDNGMAVYWHIGDSNFNLNNNNPLVSFTGVQLEVGSVATTFEHRSYGEEFALCQRYYRRYETPNSSYMPFINGNTFASTQFQASYDAIGMRNEPTLETNGTASDYQIYSGIGGQNATGVPYLDAQSRYPVLDIRVPISGATAGQGAWLRVNNNSNAFLAFDAEL